MNQDKVNNDIIIKKINDSTDFDWIIKLLEARTKLLPLTIDRIKKINSIEIQNLLQKNYS